MRHLLIFTVLFFITLSSYAQDVEVVGSMGIGAEPSDSWKLELDNNESNDTDGLSIKVGDSGGGNSYGIKTVTSFTGTGVKYGIYNKMEGSGAGNQYGFYSKVIGNSNGGKRYGLMVDAYNQAGFSRAAYLWGVTEMRGTTLFGSGLPGESVFKFDVATPVTGDQYSLSISPPQINTNYDWDNTKALKFYETGELQKRVTDGSDVAFSIQQWNDGQKVNFYVRGDGHVFAREIEVSLDPFPDYVFAEDYELMPLKELETYIEENNHLPNIPAAEEVKEAGLGLGELSILELEKIEELTLYLLQLNERLESLESENSSLKQQVQTLTNQVGQ